MTQLIKCLVLSESIDGYSIPTRAYMVTQDGRNTVLLVSSGVEIGVLEEKTLKIRLTYSDEGSWERIELPGWDEKGNYWYSDDTYEDRKQAEDVRRAFASGAKCVENRWRER